MAAELQFGGKREHNPRLQITNKHSYLTATQTILVAERDFSWRISLADICSVFWYWRLYWPHKCVQ